MLLVLKGIENDTYLRLYRIHSDHTSRLVPHPVTKDVWEAVSQKIFLYCNNVEWFPSTPDSTLINGQGRAPGLSTKADLAVINVKHGSRYVYWSLSTVDLSSYLYFIDTASV